MIIFGYETRIIGFVVSFGPEVGSGAVTRAVSWRSGYVERLVLSPSGNAMRVAI